MNFKNRNRFLKEKRNQPELPCALSTLVVTSSSQTSVVVGSVELQGGDGRVGLRAEITLKLRNVRISVRRRNMRKK